MRVIYIDDEKPARDNFCLTVSQMPEVRDSQVFRSAEQALEWVRDNPVDVAFLDIEMPGCDGLSLSRELHELRPDMRIVFVTAYIQYALDAWQTEAVGYVLKPYSVSDLRKWLERASCYRPKPRQRVEIRTFPNLSVFVDGKPVLLKRAKPRELLALLVERGDAGVNPGHAIACLWPERRSGNDTQSLFRMTYKRLVEDLEKEGIANILTTKGNIRALRTDLVDCDLYRFLAGEQDAIDLYRGEFLQEYTWAESRNAQLYFNGGK